MIETRKRKISLDIFYSQNIISFHYFPACKYMFIFKPSPFLYNFLSIQRALCFYMKGNMISGIMGNFVCLPSNL